MEVAVRHDDVAGELLLQELRGLFSYLAWNSKVHSRCLLLGAGEGSGNPGLSGTACTLKELQKVLFNGALPAW